MKKIPSLFQRNYDGDRLVRDEVVPGSEWVLEGEGVPTEKWDGTSCLVRDGTLYKRFDCKKGRTPPENWKPCEPERNEHTGHWPGWVPVGDGPEDKWHREAWGRRDADYVNENEGTYELVGPKVQGNPYKRLGHSLWRHGTVDLKASLSMDTRSFGGIKEWLGPRDIEGIVWHHPDGRMVKIKRRDFGLPWPR